MPISSCIRGKGRGQDRSSQWDQAGGSRSCPRSIPAGHTEYLQPLPIQHPESQCLRQAMGLLSFATLSPSQHLPPHPREPDSQSHQILQPTPSSHPEPAPRDRACLHLHSRQVFYGFSLLCDFICGLTWECWKRLLDTALSPACQLPLASVH